MKCCGVCVYILQLLFGSIWKGSGKRSSHKNQEAILLVSKIHLEVLKHSFQPPLIFKFGPSQS